MYSMEQAIEKRVTSKRVIEEQVIAEHVIDVDSAYLRFNESIFCGDHHSVIKTIRMYRNTPYFNLLLDHFAHKVCVSWLLSMKFSIYEIGDEFFDIVFLRISKKGVYVKDCFTYANYNLENIKVLLRGFMEETDMSISLKQKNAYVLSYLPKRPYCVLYNKKAIDIETVLNMKEKDVNNSLSETYDFYVGEFIKTLKPFYRGFGVVRFNTMFRKWANNGGFYPNLRSDCYKEALKKNGIKMSHRMRNGKKMYTRN